MKIIVELMHPQESNYIAGIPLGCLLIELVIFPRKYKLMSIERIWLKFNNVVQVGSPWFYWWFNGVLQF